jgi:hypothetical protein
MGRKTARPAPRAAPEISRKTLAKISIDDSDNRRPQDFNNLQQRRAHSASR